mgnify:CR=1 FL=1
MGLKSIPGVASTSTSEWNNLVSRVIGDRCRARGWRLHEPSAMWADVVRLWVYERFW